MSIEKKSLISTLKTTKKANVASGPVKPETDVKPDHVMSKRLVVRSQRMSQRASMKSMKKR